MYAFLISAGVSAVGEIGDKTQLLTHLLALRFHRPWPIILGILTATLLNHAVAGALGTWLRTLIDANVLRYVVGGSFVLIAQWALVPAHGRLASSSDFVTLLNTFVLVRQSRSRSPADMPHLCRSGERATRRRALRLCYT